MLLNRFVSSFSKETNLNIFLFFFFEDKQKMSKFKEKGSGAGAESVEIRIRCNKRGMVSVQFKKLLRDLQKKKKNP